MRIGYFSIMMNLELLCFALGFESVLMCHWRPILHVGPTPVVLSKQPLKKTSGRFAGSWFGGL